MTSQSALATRRQTRQIHVGSVAVGGGAPISVQSMTTTKTADVDGTLSQVYALAAAGADIVRCTCNEPEAAEGLARIVPRSPVPIVADIHFHHEMALAALEAGVQGLRLNPGNLRKEEEIKQVASEAKDRGVPIRIGVNAGSLDKRLYKQFGGATPEALVESARIELAYFSEVGFDDVKISVKASNVPLMIEAYRLASETFDHPCISGSQKPDRRPAGLLKGTAGIATLLAEGIGDTIRYSLTADPVEEAHAPVGNCSRRWGFASEGSRPDRVPLVRTSRDRRDRSGQIGARSARGQEPSTAGRRHGLCGERPGRGERGGSRHSGGPAQGTPLHKGRDHPGGARAGHGRSPDRRSQRLVEEGVEARLAAADKNVPAEAEADPRGPAGSSGMPTTTPSGSSS